MNRPPVDFSSKLAITMSEGKNFFFQKFPLKLFLYLTSRLTLFSAPVCQSGAVSNLKPSQIVSYEYVKGLEKCPEKLLIDVREPSELVDDGKIPTSINIPCEFSYLEG